VTNLQTQRTALSLPLPLTHLKKFPKTLERRSRSRILLVDYLLVAANNHVHHVLVLIFILVVASLILCKESLHLLLLLRLLLVFKLLDSLLGDLVPTVEIMIVLDLVPITESL